MLQDLSDWLLKLVKAIFSTLGEFVVDMFIGLFDMLAQALLGLLSVIPLPGFVTDGMQTVFSALDPGIMWIVTQCGIVTAFSILGGAYVFRMARKVVTLFQW